MAETKTKTKPTHPPYIEMAKDAIVSLGDKKGASVPAIQSYIVGKYTLDADIVKQHLKPALAKGLENGALVRPKNSDAKGYTGRFKINKEKASEEAKAKKLKEKAAKEKAAKKVTGEGAKKKPLKKKPPTGENAKKKTSATKKKTPTKIKQPPGKAAVKPKAVKVLFVCNISCLCQPHPHRPITCLRASKFLRQLDLLQCLDYILS